MTLGNPIPVASLSAPTSQVGVRVEPPVEGRPLLCASTEPSHTPAGRQGRETDSAVR